MSITVRRPRTGRRLKKELEEGESRETNRQMREKQRTQYER